MPIENGSNLGRYHVNSLIASGGMGEVYLAHDVQLGRPVALKLLLEEYTQSREHLRRFEQEARATSALNHPNILTVFEIGEVQSRLFIATEFVKGQTVRQIMRRKRLKLDEVINIITQVATGLVIAHSAGIIHRDIKPENIMVREDGIVKILDFGLAKLIDLPVISFQTTEDSTIANMNTNSGAIIGTVSYMSPEQLRGMVVDARTDVWSLGVVLYEMMTGRIPFGADSPADVIVSILQEKPSPISIHAPGCPTRLQQIVSKALTKDRERRYQSVAEFLSDVRELQGRLESENTYGQPLKIIDNGSPRSQRSHHSVERVSLSGQKRVSSTTLSPTVNPGNLVQLSQVMLPTIILLTSIILSFTVGSVSKALSVVILLAGLCLSVLAYVWARRASRQTTPFQSIRLTKLTNTGKAIEAVISPDAKYIVYVSEKAGYQSLWVRQVATASNVQIVPPTDINFRGITFSQDGNYVYYTYCDNTNNRMLSLYQVPVLGGTPKKVMEDVDTAITFSPDGSEFAFVRGYPSRYETALMVAASNGTNERKLATRNSPDDFGWRGAPAWSPDGKMIACAAGIYDVEMTVVGVRVEDGAEQQLTMQSWPWVGRVAWLNDGSGLVLVGRDQSSGVYQIWGISYPKGEVRRITNDLQDYGVRSISLSSDSSALVSVHSEYISGIWVAANASSDQPRQLTTGRSDGYYGLSWTPDGKIVYSSKASGNQDIWIMEADGSNQTQLTFDAGLNYHPSVTQDGRYVLFVSTRSGEPAIWRMNIDGSNAIALTEGSSPGWPSCSPDGEWVYFKRMGFNKRSLHKVSIDGGESIAVSEKYTGCFDISPDGKLIVCEYWDEQVSSCLRLAVLPTDGQEPVKTFPISQNAVTQGDLLNVIHWIPDSSAFAYVDNRGGFSNIWCQPINGDPPRQLTNFPGDKIFWFAWSRDGASLACARGLVTNDVVLISSS